LMILGLVRASQTFAAFALMVILAVAVNVLLIA